jgi:hypothetical protein
MFLFIGSTTAMNTNHVLGTVCIIGGLILILFTLGDLLVRLIITVCALSVINYGLKLRGLPPLQVLIPLLANRRRWF